MVQDIVWTFFNSKKYLENNDNILGIYMVSPYGKLSIYNGSEFFDTSQINSKYKKNKYLGVKYTEYFLCK